MRRHLTKLLFAGTLLILVAAVACGDSVNDTQSAEPTEPAAAASDTAVPEEVAAQLNADTDVGEDTFDVDIVNFQHQSITVEVGTTVKWTNQDQIPHTVTSGAPGGQTDLFDTSNLGNQGTFSFTFDQEGEFTYFCRIHPTMTATVTVVSDLSGIDTDVADKDDAVAMEDSGAMTEDDDALTVADGDAMDGDGDAMEVDHDAKDAKDKQDDALAVADDDAMAVEDDLTMADDGDAMAMEDDNTDRDGESMAMGDSLATTLTSSIVNFKLASLTIGVGTTIEWSNADGVGHTVTSGIPGDAAAGDIWDSGNLIASLTFSHTFNVEGEFVYYCRFHPSMTGTITVTSGS